MKTVQTAATTEYFVAAETTEKQMATEAQPSQREKSKDLVLNVGFEESMVRGFAAIFLPWPFVFINPYLLIAVAPVMFYLFVSALTHFCLLRYAWQHWIKHVETPAICDFATGLHIPVETI